MTNREWLESLDDIKLALWLCDKFLIDDGEYSYEIGITNIRTSGTDSFRAVFNWLKREAVSEEVIDR